MMALGMPASAYMATRKRAEEARMEADVARSEREQHKLVHWQENN